MKGTYLEIEIGVLFIVIGILSILGFLGISWKHHAKEDASPGEKASKARKIVGLLVGIIFILVGFWSLNLGLFD